MKELMVKAHQIAKTLEGDYQARLAIALKQAWAEKKSEKKIVIAKQTEKAKMLVLRFFDITGEERKINTWFPNGWLKENNIPKVWALKKKVGEIKEQYSEWGLYFTGFQVA